MTLGVHFAITDEQMQNLAAAKDDEARRFILEEEIEASVAAADQVETDKAWDGIHRCLSEFPAEKHWFYPVPPDVGTYALPEDHGSYPLKLCVLGGKRMMDDESNYFIRAIEPAEVADIPAALKPIDQAELRKRYFTYCKDVWPEFGEDDFDYTWEYFQEMRAFFDRVARSGKHVIFTAPQ